MIGLWSKQLAEGKEQARGLRKRRREWGPTRESEWGKGREM